MPINQRTNSSRTRVEEPSRRSREFHVEQDGLTLEIVHAAELLKNYFEGLGCEDWILMGVCSRKLLERVNERRPNMSNLGQWTGGPEPVPQNAQQRLQAEAGRTYDGVLPGTVRAFRDALNPFVPVEEVNPAFAGAGQHIAVDPHPYEQIMVGPPPNGLMPPGLTPEEAQRWQQHFRTLSPADQMQRTYDDYMNRTQPFRERVVQETHMSAEEFNEMNHQALVNQTITELGPVTGSQPALEDTHF